MNDSPETRHSLLFRLQGSMNQSAWNEFLEIYQPLLFRMVQGCGVRQQDAADAVQEILMTIYRSIPRYEPREHPYAFRGWLSKIARNTTINYLQRRCSKDISGGTTLVKLIHEQPDQRESMERIWDQEHHRQILESAAVRVSQRVNPKTFSAFWRTVVDGETIDVVSRELEMSPGSIYVARGRIMAHLQKEIALLQGMDTNEESS